MTPDRGLGPAAAAAAAALLPCECALAASDAAGARGEGPLPLPCPPSPGTNTEADAGRELPLLPPPRCSVVVVAFFSSSSSLPICPDTADARAAMLCLPNVPSRYDSTAAVAGGQSMNSKEAFSGLPFVSQSTDQYSPAEQCKAHATAV